jgi:flavin reductase (DIM6/NTAB) family NADH-FMN oxidoreductase RutF
VHIRRAVIGGARSRRWPEEDAQTREPARYAQVFVTWKGRLMPISGDTYKQIGRSAAGAVSVVTAYDRASEKIVGLTVSSFVTLSFDPPLVMFAIQHDTDSYRSMVSSRCFGVSLLRQSQAEVAALFASKGPEKTGKTAFQEGATLHVPLIPDALAHVECLTNQIFISGDHAIVVGLVEEARTFDGQPLLYFARQYGTFSPL